MTVNVFMVDPKEDTRVRAELQLDESEYSGDLTADIGVWLSGGKAAALAMREWAGDDAPQEGDEHWRNVIVFKGPYDDLVALFQGFVDILVRAGGGQPIGPDEDFVASVGGPEADEPARDSRRSRIANLLGYMHE